MDSPPAISIALAIQPIACDMSTIETPGEFIGDWTSTSNHAPDQTRERIGRTFGLSSVALFLFLMTFTIAISTVTMGNRLRGALVLGMMLLMLLGAIGGLIAILLRGKPADTVALVMGIAGLCLNGLFLLGMFLIILFGVLGVIVSMHRAPVAATAQPQPPTVVYHTLMTPRTPMMAPMTPRPMTPYMPYYRPYNPVPRH